MARFQYFILYKPFNVLTQFTDPVGGKMTLGDVYPFPKDVYPIGRLDEDSEGLLLLTNDPAMNKVWLDAGVEKEYYVQVEGIPKESDLQPLRQGLELRIKKKAFRTLPAGARLLQPAPVLPERNPPIRFRQSVPDAWIAITLREGKNRQVRKMTAAIGFPTLRLVRWRMGPHTLEGLEPGQVRELKKL
ncbi:MAG: pseudouridine synthase [Bacteroidia bacterium]|nr:pseudouridine synthase [Bacteroidia bacterium]